MDDGVSKFDRILFQNELLINLPAYQFIDYLLINLPTFGLIELINEMLFKKYLQKFFKRNFLSKANTDTAYPVCRCWAFSGDKRDEYLPDLNEFTSLIILIKIGSGIFTNICITSCFVMGH